MFGWITLIFGDIMGFFRDERRVKEQALMEMKRKQRASRQPTVENNKELDDAIAAFLNRVTTKKPAAESTAPAAPTEGAAEKSPGEPQRGPPPS